MVLPIPIFVKNVEFFQARRPNWKPLLRVPWYIQVYVEFQIPIPVRLVFNFFFRPVLISYESIFEV